MGSFTAKPVDVMLVDGRDVVREGLRTLIDQQPDLVVVSQVAAVHDAGRQDDIPDVIVTDIDLPDAKHRDVITGLRRFFQQSPILVFTAIDHPATVQSVLDAGAEGYLLETATPSDLLTGIRAVARGETYLQPELGVELARWHRPREATPALSPKEVDVLRLLALGHTNTEVANLCGVSLRTVETNRARIQRKLGRRTRADLVRYAREVGLVPDQ
jgi:two-component system, NarL family, response regulator NreC